ncbi:hypothetical protein PPERSA_11310 [Pseudocohnilembus persalinus]|uniref:Uncharacterized protein n=1 Tax=Pseudocohnilembus persalinus TaxID=266149 RepID=A0A0V0QQ83_PSEPJ|nr:hypothetical protein PPERSA_11310 [Pseudocohnilembus persalinus]|eukprot:KRX04186.1 hypothetical protein PPERSA_11310 [Pseudocohnilembus persalinus]
MGPIMKSLRCIPVERAQDLVSEGKGVIQYISSGILLGLNTKFLEQVQEGNVIIIPGVNVDFVVKKVKSNTELLVSSSMYGEELNTNYQYKIQPKIDYSDIYHNVWDALNNNECIGIFQDEKNSQENQDILPLKAGVCIMALGAMAKYNKQVTVVMAGLNYFEGNQFRSKMVLEFGQPYKIPEEFSQLYNLNKRDAIKQLLHIISERIRDVLTNIPTYKDLMSLQMAKKMYLPDQFTYLPQNKNLKEVLKLNRTKSNSLKNKNKLRNQINQFEQSQNTENNYAKTQSFEDLFKVDKRISKLKSTQDLTKVFNVMEQIDSIQNVY